MNTLCCFLFVSVSLLDVPQRPVTCLAHRACSMDGHLWTALCQARSGPPYTAISLKVSTLPCVMAQAEAGGHGGTCARTQSERQGRS